MECRVYAEDPDSGYLPSPGRMRQHRAPAGPGVRLDSGVYDGWTVPMDYDPMLAKLAVWAPTRQAAAARLDRALGEYVISGIRTNTAFFREILRDKAFLDGAIHTGYLDEFSQRRAPAAHDEALNAIVATVATLHQARSFATATPTAASYDSAWKRAGRESLLR
jgi:acetyl-CoA carboxylase biotin carboxylase subunit